MALTKIVISSQGRMKKLAGDAAGARNSEKRTLRITPKPRAAGATSLRAEGAYKNQESVLVEPQRLYLTSA